MLMIASLAPLMTLLAAPVAADAPASLPRAVSDETRCALHQLPVPAGKAAVTSVVRCADRQPVDARAAMRGAPAT